MLYVHVDVETTGLKTPHARIVEVGASVLNEKFEEIASFSSLANPGAESMALADPESLRIHGITPEEIASAPPSAEVARTFEKFLDEHWGALLFSYNREFEMWFLGREPWRVPASKWGECLMIASMEAMDRTRWPRLGVAAQFFKVPQAESHRALADARVAGKIHVAILKERLLDKSDAEAVNESSHLFEQGY